MTAPSQTIPLHFGDAGSITGRRAVQIRGVNPSKDAVEEKIIDLRTDENDQLDEHWYAQAIVDHESHGNRQFNPSFAANYRTDLGPNFTNLHGKAMPNFNYSDGWGVAQRDPWPGLDEVWNWHENIEGFIGELNTKRPIAVTWIANQVTQQQADRPDLPLSNQVFTFSGVDFQEGTDESATDACTIQLYNGAGQYVISWEQKDLSVPDKPGRWIQRTEQQQPYVYDVSDHIE